MTIDQLHDFLYENNFTHVQTNRFGGETLRKMAAGIVCNGNEQKLSECRHTQLNADSVTCRQTDMVAGVVCATGTLQHAKLGLISYFQLMDHHMRCISLKI
jgi:4'-phosphopantetheinyl transferase EntD